jgi:hypothetical protein
MIHSAFAALHGAPSSMLKHLRRVALILPLLASHASVRAGDIIWDFSDPPPPDNVAWAPPDWIREGDGGFWTFPRSGFGLPQLGAGDGVLSFVLTAFGTQDVDADIYTPSFRFSDLTTAALEFLDIDFDEASPYIADSLLISLHKENKSDLGTITTLRPGLQPELPLTVVADAPRLQSLFPGKLNTQDFYRIRIRASDTDNVPEIPNAFIADIVIRSAALKPAGNPDYDRDLDVDGADLLTWQRQLGASGVQTADGNADGIVNRADLLVWQNNFGWVLPQPVAAPAESSVPEPASLIGLAVAAAALLRRRTRSSPSNR